MKFLRNLFLALFVFLGLTSPSSSAPISLHVFKIRGQRKVIVVIGVIHLGNDGQSVGPSVFYGKQSDAECCKNVFFDIVAAQKRAGQDGLLGIGKSVDVFLEMAVDRDFTYDRLHFFELELGKRYVGDGAQSSGPFRFFRADVRRKSIESIMLWPSFEHDGGQCRGLRFLSPEACLKEDLGDQRAVLSSLLNQVKRWQGPDANQVLRNLHQQIFATNNIVRQKNYSLQDNVLTRMDSFWLREKLGAQAKLFEVSKAVVAERQREIERLRTQEDLTFQEQVRLLQLEAFSSLPCVFSETDLMAFARSVYKTCLYDLGDLGFFAQAMESQAKDDVEVTVVICGYDHAKVLGEMFQFAGYNQVRLKRHDGSYVQSGYESREEVYKAFDEDSARGRKFDRLQAIDSADIERTLELTMRCCSHCGSRRCPGKARCRVRRRDEQSFGDLFRAGLRRATQNDQGLFGAEDEVSEAVSQAMVKRPQVTQGRNGCQNCKKTTGVHGLSGLRGAFSSSKGLFG